ncbi:MAG: GFA family protein [Alphaproteobacteria bacterium]|nr:GFA family protein [Alphaproteobacteria bacterium]MDE2110111.1 GFA family protein [Alphaproteobacteria bacterium]MDE2495137.1 GFA family protein [Alphaproteobacteria bacterium]
MTARDAACSCGQLRVTCDGEPVRISVCHCQACKRRKGIAFAFNARYPREHVTAVGRSFRFACTGDSSDPATLADPVETELQGKGSSSAQVGHNAKDRFRPSNSLFGISWARVGSGPFAVKI